MSRGASPHGGSSALLRSRLFEIALVLVRLDHIASRIVNVTCAVLRNNCD